MEVAEERRRGEERGERDGEFFSEKTRQNLVCVCERERDLAFHLRELLGKTCEHFSVCDILSDYHGT